MSGQGAGQGNPGRGRPEERRGARRDSGQGPSPGARGDSGQGPSLDDPSQWFSLGRGRALIPNRGTPSHRAQAGANVQRSTDIMASLSSAARGRPYPDPAIVASGIGRGFCDNRGPRKRSRSSPIKRPRAGVYCPKTPGRSNGPPGKCSNYWPGLWARPEFRAIPSWSRGWAELWARPEDCTGPKGRW